MKGDQWRSERVEKTEKATDVRVDGRWGLARVDSKERDDARIPSVSFRFVSLGPKR